MSSARYGICGRGDAMVADFRKTLDKFKVPAAEQGELIAIVGSTKPEIVVPGK